MKNFVINFYWICSIMKIGIIYCVPAQIPYLGIFWFPRYGSFIKRQTSGTSSDNEWYNKWQRVTTNDNNWYNEWRVTTGGIEWREVTTSGNFGQTSFFQIIWCWYEPFFISLRQRLLQAVVIDVFKIYVNLSKSTIAVFLKFSTSYLLFIIKMCFFFFDEKHVLFCITKRRSS